MTTRHPTVTDPTAMDRIELLIKNGWLGSNAVGHDSLRLNVSEAIANERAATIEEVRAALDGVVKGGAGTGDIDCATKCQMLLDSLEPSR